MSDMETQPAMRECGGRGDVEGRPVRELLPGRDVPLGGSTVVRRLLPSLGRRMIGAWCFVDHYGPDEIASQPGMRVPPHPHMGLQTVSWLADGEIMHRDSLGNEQLLRPGQLGLMTSGRAISHAEQSPLAHPPILHGAQLWVALPDGDRFTDPAWEHHTDLPVISGGGVEATVILGELDTARSPGRTFSPLVGAQVRLAAGADTSIPVQPDFEYAVLAMDGVAEVDGVPVQPGGLLYLGCGRRTLPLRSDGPSGVMLLGGEPFEEKLVMWWNFVGRTATEIVDAREAWMNSDHFGSVHGYDGDPLAAPALPDLPLKPRGRQR